jgi:hypothetical protein
MRFSQLSLLAFKPPLPSSLWPSFSELSSSH